MKPKTISFIQIFQKKKVAREVRQHPPELFIASLGSYIGIYATSYLKTAGIDPANLEIELDWSLAEDKTRIGKIDVVINTKTLELAGREKALLASAKKCLIHNTLIQEPEVDLKLN